MTTYNGWDNRAAWNVALWAANDEPIYRATLANRKNLPRKRYTAASAEAWARELWPNGSTPDGDKLADVTAKGWASIARDWNS